MSAYSADGRRTMTYRDGHFFVLHMGTGPVLIRRGATDVRPSDAVRVHAQDSFARVNFTAKHPSRAWSAFESRRRSSRCASASKHAADRSDKNEDRPRARPTLSSIFMLIATVRILTNRRQDIAVRTRRSRRHKCP